MPVRGPTLRQMDRKFVEIRATAREGLPKDQASMHAAASRSMGVIAEPTHAPEPELDNATRAAADAKTPLCQTPMGQGMVVCQGLPLRSGVHDVQFEVLRCKAADQFNVGFMHERLVAAMQGDGCVPLHAGLYDCTGSSC